MLSHHAYLLIGNDLAHDSLISDLEKRQKIKVHGSQDFFDRKYQTFTVDDARELKSTAGTRPVTDSGKKIFVLTMNGITVEAQNALLKLLEEPPEYAHFFLIIPSAHLLLPTVKSRLSVLRPGDISGGGVAIPKYSNRAGKTSITAAEADSFVAMPVAKRLDAVKKLMDDISKEKKTKQDAIDFLNSIEASIHGKGVKKSAAALEAIETARKYMNDRAPSMKMLLEFVAMSI